MNIKLIPAPRKVVLNAGTYHGMFAYCPVQPNQKVPIIWTGLPIQAKTCFRVFTSFFVASSRESKTPCTCLNIFCNYNIISIYSLWLPTYGNINYKFEDEVAAVNDAMTFQYWLEEEATFKSQDNLRTPENPLVGRSKVRIKILILGLRLVIIRI